MSNLNVFDFFDNDLFVEANRDKVFSDEDKVAIVIRSVKTSLNQKFEFLNEIAKTADENLAYQIKKWIELMKLKVEDVLNVKNDEQYSIYKKSNVYYDKNSFPLTYSSVKEAIKDSSCETRIFISNNNNCIGPAIIFITDCAGREDYYDIIGNLERTPFDRNKFKREEGFRFTITRHIVELNSPFKPFDYVYAPISVFQTFVVADNNDPEVKDVKKKVEEGKLKNHLDGIFKINTPTYHYERIQDICVDGKLVENKLLATYDLQYLRCRLADIEVIDPSEMKVWEKEYIDGIKHTLKEQGRLFD